MRAGPTRRGCWPPSCPTWRPGACAPRSTSAPARARSTRACSPPTPTCPPPTRPRRCSTSGAGSPSTTSSGPWCGPRSPRRRTGRASGSGYRRAAALARRHGPVAPDRHRAGAVGAAAPQPGRGRRGARRRCDVRAHGTRCRVRRRPDGPGRTRRRRRAADRLRRRAGRVPARAGVGGHTGVLPAGRGVDAPEHRRVVRRTAASGSTPAQARDRPRRRRSARRRHPSRRRPGTGPGARRARPGRRRQHRRDDRRRARRPDDRRHPHPRRR